ncbi:MAG: DNRLRE domain-containing protein [Chloroflexi bacterium]|nr:DNRLRE domain-containing protein [Chloroflexota bacterium]
MLLLTGIFYPRMPAEGNTDLYLHFSIDRTAIPDWARAAPLTLRVVVGPATGATVNGDGDYVPSVYDAGHGALLFSTAASDVVIRVRGAISDSSALGRAEITPLKDDKSWAYSLTFDDGADSTFTNAKPILDRYGYTASAAIIGNHIGKPGFMGPAELQQLLADGWALNNHTYSHYYVSQFPNTAAVLRDISMASEAISTAVPGYTAHAFTAPFHDDHYNPIVAANSEALGLYLVEGLGAQAWRQVDGFIHGKDNFLIGRRSVQPLEPLFDEMHDKATAHPGTHYWLTLLEHGVAEACDPVEISSDYLYTHYGAGGTGEVWVAPSIDVYRYILAHDFATVTRLPDIAPQSLAEPPPTIPTPTGTPAPPSQRITVTLQEGADAYAGTTDTYISAWESSITHGTDSGMALRTGDVSFPLLQFDLHAIPAEADVVSATLSLYATWQSNGLYACGRAYGLKRPWSEDAADWYAATTTSLWGQQGASDTTTDRDPASFALRTFLSGDSRWYDFPVTWLAQRWVNTPQSNHGLLLYPSGVSSTQMDFASSEFWNLSQRPRLTIVYDLPLDSTPTPTPSPSATPSPTHTTSPTPEATATTVPAFPWRLFFPVVRVS